VTFIIAIASSVFAAVIGLMGAWNKQRTIILWSFVAGMLVLSIEAFLSGLGSAAISLDRKIYWQSWSVVAMSLLPGLWLFFTLNYARGNFQESLKKWGVLLLLILLAAPACALFARNQLFVVTFEKVHYATYGLSRWGLILYLFFLSGIVVVLMNLEQTYRAAVGTMRWRIKYVILGLGLLFVVRVYTSSQSILFHAIKPSLELINSAGLLLACLLILRSLFRAGYFEVTVYPSQAVLHHSLTFLLVGLYLLLVGVLAKMVTLFGNAADFPLKSFFVLLAIVVLTLVLFSDRMRLETRRFISRNFQRPIYNYRTVWRSFAETTASCLEQNELGREVVKLLSNIFQTLSVTIWVSDPSDEKLRLAASSSLLKSGENVAKKFDAADMAEIIHGVKNQTEPVDIDASKEKWAQALRKIHPVEFHNGGHRLCVPLVAGGNLQGLIIIGDRVGGIAFSAQDIDLLKCAGDQAAASLLNIRLSKKLVEAKELEAFQTMSAFFVHDLKNTASTLSLMLQNFAVHYNDPAFKEDALRGISKSVHHIDDLIKRLTLFREKAVSGTKEFDLNELVNNVLADLKLSADLKIQKNLQPLPKQPFDPEQIGKVVTNLLLNAKEASSGNSEIRIETSRQNGWTVLSIHDQGCGMTPDFAENSLFRPFQTTKKSGIGIGMFQSKMIVEAHRGKIEFETQLGKGTTFRILLPLTQESK
jgi:putative PEP-CTERM system histidine kinase